MESNAVSKKGAALLSGLTIIAAQDDFKSQIVLSTLLIVYIIVQGFLDWSNRKIPPAT